MLVFGLSISSLAILLPASPAWAASGGTGSLGAGATTAVLMAVTVATQFSVPTLTRKFSWATVLAAGALLMGIPSLIQALSPALPNVLATSALRGIGFGIMTVCCSSALSYLIPLEHRARAIGTYGLAAATAQLIFTPLAPWAIDTLGYRPVIAIGTIAALATPFAYRLGRQVDTYFADLATQPEEARTPVATGDIVRRIWPALLTLTLATSVGGAFMTFATELAPTATIASAGLLLLCAAATPTRLWGGTLTDRWGTRLLMSPVLLATSIGVALIGLAAGGWQAQTALILAGATIVGVGYGFLQSVTMVRALNDAGGPDATQRASVAWNSHFDIGTGLGALALGAAAQATSFSTAWLGAAVLLALCATFTGLLDARTAKARA